LRPKRKIVATLDQFVRVLEQGAGPFDGGDEFGRADAAVLVRVNQRGGFGVELQTGGGAGQRTHNFWSSWSRFSRSAPVSRFDLVEAAGAEEPPAKAEVAEFGIGNVNDVVG